MKVAVIGLGSITRGVLSALSQATEVDEIVATRRSAQDNVHLPAGVTVICQEQRADANVVAVRDADVVMICTKPHQVGVVLQEIRADLAPGVTLISVAAGLGFDTLRSNVGPGPQLARLLPNTAAGVGEGVIGLLLQEPDPACSELLASWFAPVGMVVHLADEAAVDVLSAVSGSGPAYVFRLIEAMAGGAVAMGLDEQEAERICRQVVVGAAALLGDAPDTSAPELRRAVTSPAGTTEKAMEVIDGAEPEDLMTRAFRASVAHAGRLNSAS
ncbi:pyrroline-5-carboxylate reductase family protein [Aeromicrobium sp. CTD01-1L150]|uniref:pyrroline-5-carboxylate reductase family protein n=1 Tax=Aeromicrobium sp. CTD01-1L150 TaxID=3341830 RepID=UPI0035BF723C